MKSNYKLRDIVFYLLRISITVVLLIFLFHKVDIGKIVEVIRGLNLYFFIGVASIYVFIVFLAIVRWYLLLKTANIKVPFKRVIISYSTGLFINMFLPSSIGGDIARSFDIFSYAEDKSKIFASVILDRLSGLVSVVLVSFFALLIGYRLVNDFSVVITFGILLGVLLFIMFICFSRRAFRIFTFFFNRFSSIKNKLIHFNEAMVFFRNKKSDLVKNLGVSVLLRLGIIIVFYFTSIALHHRTNIIYFLIFVPIIEAISSAPITIGGLGVRDAAVIFLFTKVGFSSDIAFSMSLINFFLAALTGFIGGIIYVITLHTRRI